VVISRLFDHHMLYICVKVIALYGCCLCSLNVISLFWELSAFILSLCHRCSHYSSYFRKLFMLLSTYYIVIAFLKCFSNNLWCGTSSNTPAIYMILSHLTVQVQLTARHLSLKQLLWGHLSLRTIENFTWTMWSVLVIDDWKGNEVLNME
jgi:hypothetical protein